MQALAAAGRGGISMPPEGDEFDSCTGEPECVFVNPFACRVNPCQWRELQDVVRKDLPSSRDPEEALMLAGVGAPPGAICYLTPEQLGAAEALLSQMDETLAYDIADTFLSDGLRRAARANGFLSR